MSWELVLEDVATNEEDEVGVDCSCTAAFSGV